MFFSGHREALILFEIDSDPYETTNVASNNPAIVNHMIGLIEDYKKDALNSWM